MSKRKQDFSFEAMQDPEAIVTYLKALTRGFEEGSLTFRGNGESITLSPEGLIHMDLQALRKADRCKLSLRFSWRPVTEKDSAADTLQIDAGEDHDG